MSRGVFLNRFFQMMKKRQFVVFDTEYTAWENSRATNWENQPRELVQIAAMKFSSLPNPKLLGTKNILIKPTLIPQLSEYFMNLTKLSQKQIDESGKELDYALIEFKEFAQDSDIYSYGPDREIMLENLKRAEFSEPFFYRYSHWLNENCFDVCELFRNYGVDTAHYSSGTLYQHYDLDLKQDGKENVVHNALWDANSLYHSMMAQYKLTMTDK